MSFTLMYGHSSACNILFILTKSFTAITLLRLGSAWLPVVMFSTIARPMPIDLIVHRLWYLHFSIFVIPLSFLPRSLLFAFLLFIYFYIVFSFCLYG